jgi:hypothetical protein
MLRFITPSASSKMRRAYFLYQPQAVFGRIGFFNAQQDEHALSDGRFQVASDGDAGMFYALDNDSHSVLLFVYG